MRSTRAALTLLLTSLLLSTTCQEGGSPPADDSSELTATPREPRVRLRISGFMQGRLEPCGCASGQLGGLPRRVFHLKQERDYDLLIEGGNLVGGGSLLDAHKMRTALTVLSTQAEYHALGLGAGDLALPVGELGQYLQGFPIDAVCSDLVGPEDGSWPVQPWLEKPAGEARVRIASLAALDTETHGEGLQRLDPAAAWARAMEGVDDSTYRVLLVHGTPELAREQAGLTPRPDLIVGITDEIAEPPTEAEPADGVPLVFPGTRGRMLLDVSLTRIDGEPRLTRYEIVRLKASETAKGALEDPTTKEILLFHRMEVQQDQVLEKMAGQLPTPNDWRYVGSEACADCHQDAYDVWTETKHFDAWKTLEEAETGERYGWPVTDYPDCVTCHVVGYGYRTGFVTDEKTPHLQAVGCEQCHGPGSKHIEEDGGTEDDFFIARSGQRECLTCHDFEQSPDFREKYQERWEAIKHD